MPFISSLNKNIWACYIPPFPDELFTSWFFRISQEHIVKSHSFGKYYFAKQQFWNRDVDNTPTDYLKRIIFENTPLEFFAIENLFLTSYEAKLFENHNPVGITTGILPLGIHHRKRKHNGLLYCPLCLGKKAFFKKQWRLLISYVCVECGIFLRDCCYNCQQPITFHRLEQGKKQKIEIESLIQCSFCNNDLTKNFEHATKDQIKNQIQIYKILESGYAHNIPYSFSYFYLLQTLSNLLSRNHDTWGRLRKACETEFGILPEEKGSFFSWSIEKRRPLFDISCKLANDYSYFQYIIGKYNLRLSEFNKDHMLPYSFENIFKRL